ncbi:MAG: hypothetical protein VB133_13285 [Anaeromusa sp.]|uniref:hypothetical protein n=1 Tax=Anaeromusa sp. TaxID=1872520 RepID=UPI002B20D3FD|nr:hypothetical protein [Anaeromusa sp.]MEA4836092.1 hypothetical protein [Anaeromusa sp.]
MLNQDFITQTLKLLEGSDVQLRFPETTTLELGNNGEKISKMFLFDRMGVVTPLQGNIAFLVMLYFTVVDAYIDTINPLLEGESFSKRYRGLAGNNDKQIILSQVYRILKVLRNSATHSRNSFRLNGGVLTVSYQFKGTQFKLKVSQSGLELIGTVVTYLATDQPQSEAYTEALIRTFYEDIRQEVTVIEDEFGVSLEPISQGVKLKRGRRIKVENPTISHNNVSITFNVPSLDPMEQEFSNYDFPLSINGANYLIPAEVLDMNGEIPCVQLIDWAL